MNLIRFATGTAALALGFLFLGCNTVEPRPGSEDSSVAENFALSEVREIVVMPVDSTAVDAEDYRVVGDPPFPALEMRRMMRSYLIRRKNYTTPTIAWVDGRIGEGGDFETDAVLNVTINDWNTDRLAARGVIYGGATFELTRAGRGDVLWTYECEDLQLPVDGPHGGRSTMGNMKAAARQLVESALSRLPLK